MNTVVSENDSPTLKTLLDNYIFDTENPERNFDLALYYDSTGHCASAISYYIRTAERSTEPLLQYECLLRAGLCFERQGTRGLSVRAMLQHAIAMMPRRPEAYFLLSRYYEKANEPESWFYCYTFASIGYDIVDDKNLEPLRTKIDYPGRYGLLFEKAISSWWCGLCEESKVLLKDLIQNHDLDDPHRKAVLWNLKRLNELNSKSLTLYDKSKFDKLMCKFPGAENIEQNYAESYQDMFVLSMLNGRHGGTYLEIGAGAAFYGSNTALLEKTFGWRGVGLDLSADFVSDHQKNRKNPCLLKDATLIDYEKFLQGQSFPKDIDYLQLDCDPPDITYKILLSIPFESRRFAVISYEHDYYADETQSYREKSRNYLRSFGYVLVAGDIAPDEWRNYEDWWVHPDLVDPEILKKFQVQDSNTKTAEQYMFGEYNRGNV